MIVSEDWWLDGILFFLSTAIKFTAQRSINSLKDIGELCCSGSLFLIEQLFNKTIFCWLQDSGLRSCSVPFTECLPIRVLFEYGWLIWVIEGEMIANLQWIQYVRKKRWSWTFSLVCIFLSTIELEVVEDLKGWTSFGRIDKTTNPQGHNQNQGSRNALNPWEEVCNLSKRKATLPMPNAFWTSYILSNYLLLLLVASC